MAPFHNGSPQHCCSSPIKEVTFEAAPLEAPDTYNVLDEEVPDHHFFSHGFQESITTGIRIAQDTVGAIKLAESILQDSALDALFEDAKRLATFKPSTQADTKTFAVLGDSGLGKSSLINSLLHCPGLSKTGDMGSACTSVVTEFRQKLDTQTEPITIEAQYLSQTEIEEYVAELLWSFQKLYLPDMEEDQEEDESCVAESSHAWSALEAAFGHHRNFSEDLLKDASTEGHKRAKEQLIEWCRQIEWPKGGDGSIWTDAAKTAEQCCEKTEIFSSNQFWPFTKMIRIYLDSPILQNGIVLADLPGLQGTNLARVQVTQAYLLKCSNILLVTNISRAITDRSLNKSLFKLIKRHIPLEWDRNATRDIEIAIICTKTDDIDETRAKKNVALLKNYIDLLLLEDIEANIDVARLACDEVKAKEMEKERKVLLVNARNEHVKQELQKAYASKIPNQKLQVFCVSNKWYEKHCRDGKLGVVKASGIPELRKYCRVAAADIHFREASYFLQASLPGLLNSLKMYGEDMLSSEASQKIQGAIDETEIALTAAIDTFAEDFGFFFQEKILKTAEDRCPIWLNTVEKQWTEWNNWHHAQFRAWCANNGNHATPGRKQRNWNADIISQMRSETRPLWDLVDENISHLIIFFSTSIRDALKELEGVAIAKAPDCARDALTTLIENQIKHTSYLLFKFQDKFKGRVRLLRQSVLEANSNSYVLKQMIQTYRKASVISGVGSSKMRKEMVRKRLTDKYFFTLIFKRLAQGLVRDIKKTKQELRKDFSQAIFKTRREIGMAVTSVEMDPVQQREKKRLLRRIQKSQRRVDTLAKSAASRWIVRSRSSGYSQEVVLQG